MPHGAPLGLAYIFIPHDLALVRLGASTEELLTNPWHDYTRALLDSSPALHEEHAPQ